MLEEIFEWFRICERSYRKIINYNFLVVVNDLQLREKNNKLTIFYSKCVLLAIRCLWEAYINFLNWTCDTTLVCTINEEKILIYSQLIRLYGFLYFSSSIMIFNDLRWNKFLFRFHFFSCIKKRKCMKARVFNNIS